MLLWVVNLGFAAGPESGPPSEVLLTKLITPTQVTYATVVL